MSQYPWWIPLFHHSVMPAPRYCPCRWLAQFECSVDACYAHEQLWAEREGLA